MEQSVDAVATVCSDHAAVLLLGHLLDDVSEFTDQNSGLDRLDGLVQTLSRRLNNTHVVRVGLGLVADIVRLVEIGMVPFMVDGNVDVEDITVEE